jgi:hypothetical protein
VTEGTREDDWAPLRDAVPAFSARWDELRGSARPGRVETVDGLIELAVFIALRLEEGDEGPLFAVADAFESVYASADEALEGLLRAGILEDLIHAAEDHGVDLVRLWLRLGPAGREAWAAAYRYTHHGEEWPRPPPFFVLSRSAAGEIATTFLTRR